MRAGRGVLTTKAGQKYEGSWLLSKRHGKGLETWPNGDKYDGEYKFDFFDGKGALKTRSGWCARPHTICFAICALGHARTRVRVFLRG